MLLCFRVHEGKDEGVLVSAFLFVGASFGGGLLCSLFLILFFCACLACMYYLDCTLNLLYFMYYYHYESQ